LLRTFGCQMNTRDSEALLGLFLDRGFTQSFVPEEADVILINTCSVRDNAESRAVSFASTLKGIMKDNKPIIGIIGCMAKNKGKELYDRLKHVNLICAPAVAHRIPAYIERIIETGERIIDIEDIDREEEFYSSIFREDRRHAQVVISTGCSNYCSYCIVPYVRGDLRFREPGDILAEVESNVKNGNTRITLLGQNVNDYRCKIDDEIMDFADLLAQVSEIEGIEEIDFVSANPKNTSRKLLEVMAKSEKIKKHLHIPFQSGSNRILKLMNRGYTREDYLKLIDDYKLIVNGTLSADIIVGFPSETDEDFLRTKDIVGTVKFNFAFIFKYSPREGTKAALMEDDVSKEVKEERHSILLDLQKRISIGMR
ncbi:MAG: tRNA (N6-isopentenyl adenosine(37)-C2)-methylthiotransferase MiaB, partial [Candidatus Omnitrophica bacterium]|nr:tRNA (N6-isopentenyl adenosine(37)-C2)-methylthiotransferase MiaB [Candidatus Omnitrophota bacterium]